MFYLGEELWSLKAYGTYWSGTGAIKQQKRSQAVNHMKANKTCKITIGYILKCKIHKSIYSSLTNKQLKKLGANDDEHFIKRL